MARLLAHTIAGFMLVTCMACRANTSDDAVAPTFPELAAIRLPIDSVEAAGGAMEQPQYAFSVAADGRIYIADQGANSIFAFDPSGRFIKRYGRFGRGLGEFDRISGLSAISESLLVASSYASRRLLVFSRTTAAPLVDRQYDGHLSSIVLEQDTLLLSFSEPLEKGVIRRLSTEQLRTSDSALTLGGNRFGRPPRVWRDVPRLLSFADTKAISDTSGIIVAFSGADQLALLDRAGNPLRRVGVPAVRRYGVQAKELERLQNSRSQDIIDSVRISAILGLHRLPSGSVAAWHYDPHLDRAPGEQFRLWGPAWISILSPDLSKGCFDIPVPFGGDDRPRLAFAGDTLYSLEVAVGTGPSGDGVERIMRRFSLSPSRCEQRATQPLPAVE